MLIKLTPEDFVVQERTTIQTRGKGPVAVYELRKRKMDTFGAIRMLASRAGIPMDRFGYLGLKDRQGVTTQLIWVTRGRIPNGLRVPKLKIRYLGRLKTPPTRADLLGNAFKVVVRDLSPDQAQLCTNRLPRVAQQGYVNYYDDQRFGTLVAGQDLPGRALVQGDHEEAVRQLIAVPGRRDPQPEKKFKRLVQACWGDWDLIATKWGNRKGASMVRHLRRRPGDFTGALSRMPARERAIHVFAFQSLLWNNTVAGYLQERVPARRLLRTPYVAGEHVWLEGKATPDLVDSVPLLDHEVQVEDPTLRAAVDAALAAENLTQEQFIIEGIPGCFLRAEPRALRILPQDLERVDGPRADERRPGRLRLTLSFQLPPGAYATLLIKRLLGETAKPRARRSGRRSRRSRGRRRTRGRA